jgi:hypothetical protein
MQLLTKAIQQRFIKIGSQEHIKDPLVIVKFFNPSGAGTWLATEYDPKTRQFFGYVSIFGDYNDEWGYFSLDELEQIKLPPFGLKVERDRYFTEQPIKKLIKQYTRS